MDPRAWLSLLLAAGSCAVPNPAFNASGSEGQDAGAGSTSSAGSGPDATDPSTPGGTAASSDPTTSTTTTSATLDGTTGTNGSSTGDVANPWWDTDYGRRVSLKFSPRDEPLLGFSAFVDLNLGDAVFKGTERHQFVFVEVATGMRLPAETVQVTSSGGRLRAWVRLPVWGDRVATQVDLYWDPKASKLEPLSPWGPEYLGVWHMDAISDSTEVANSADGPALVGVGASNASDLAGVAYRAIEFDGNVDRLAADFEGASIDPYFSVYAWARIESFATNGAPLFARGGRVGPEEENTEWLLRFYSDSTHARVHTNGGTPQEFFEDPEELGGWRHYVLQANLAEWALFVDGQRVAESDADYSGVLEHENPLLSVGGYGGAAEVNWSSRLFDGLIDEVVWRQGGDLSDVWIETLFENQGDPESTYDVGPIETLDE